MTALRILISRRGLLLVLLAVLFAGLIPLIPAPAAHADPCDGIDGPAKDYCERGDSGEDAGSDGPPKCLERLNSNPAAGMFANTSVRPERPRDGAAGMFASPPKNPSGGRGQAHLYEQYGLAGLTWHTYSPDCKGDAGSWAETKAADLIMDGARWWSGLALAVQRQAGADSAVRNLDPVVATATERVRDAVMSPWIGVSVALLGTVLVWQSRTRRMHQVMQAAGWALLVMTLATTVISYPTHASRIADRAITSTVGQIQQGIAGGGHGQSLEVSQGNLISGRLLYDQWLRGQLGSTTSKTATTYGPKLYAAQALTWREEQRPQKQRTQVAAGKEKAWKKLAAEIKDKDPDAYRHLTGQAGGRLAAAFTAALSVAPAVIFTIAVGAVIVCALLVIRLAVIFAPALAPLGIHRQTAGTLHSLGKSLAAALIHAPLFALAGALDVLLIGAFLSPSAGLPTWFAVFLTYVVTWMLWRMSRPLRSMSSLVKPHHDYMGAGLSTFSGTASNVRKGAAKFAGHYVTSRLSARSLARYLGGGSASKKKASTPAGEDTSGEAEEPTTAGTDEAASTPVDTEETLPGAEAGTATPRRDHSAGEEGAPRAAGETLGPDGSTVYTIYTPTGRRGDAAPGETAPGATPGDVPGGSSTPGSETREAGTPGPGGPEPGGSRTAADAGSGEHPTAARESTAEDGARAYTVYTPTGHHRSRTGAGPRTGPDATSGPRSHSTVPGATSTPEDDSTGPGTGATAAGPDPHAGAAPHAPNEAGAPQPAAAYRDEDGSTIYTIYTPTGGFRRSHGTPRSSTADGDTGDGGGRHSTPDEEGPS